MDWTKAKNILIVALILTNLVLLFTYAFQDNSLSETEDTVLADTIALLETKDIFVQIPIPKKHGRMPVLTVEYSTTDRDLLEQKLASQDRLPPDQRSERDLRNKAEHFLKDCGLFTENVVYESLETTGKETIVRFSNQINGICIEESEIICTIKDGKVVDVEREWLEPVALGKMKKEIIPAAAALIKFMTDRDEEGKIYVEDITLVYWLDTYTSSLETASAVSDTAFPAWKITYNHGKVSRVVAYEQ